MLRLDGITIVILFHFSHNCVHPGQIKPNNIRFTAYFIWLKSPCALFFVCSWSMFEITEINFLKKHTQQITKPSSIIATSYIFQLELWSVVTQTRTLLWQCSKLKRINSYTDRFQSGIFSSLYCAVFFFFV